MMPMLRCPCPPVKAETFDLGAVPPVRLTTEGWGRSTVIIAKETVEALVACLGIVRSLVATTYMQAV